MSKFSYYLLASLVILFSACGGGGSSSVFLGTDGGSSDSNITATTLSGTITDDPVNGATVKVLSLMNDELANGVTDANGSYKIEVSQEKIANGFMIEATGGTINGVDFNGTLRGIYSSEDNITQLNATLITSLVAKMAIDENATGSDLLTQRDVALEKLVDIGIVKKSDWSSENPSLVNMERLRADVSSKGVEPWIDSMIADLKDNEISVDMMRIFGMAHGGLSKLIVSPNNFISVFPGQEKDVVIFPEFTDVNDKNITVEKLSGPSWVSVVNGNELHIAPDSSLTTYDDFTVSIEVFANGVKDGRTKNIFISLIKKVVLVSGELGSNSGKIENQWKDISVSVDAGKLSQTYQIQYNAGITNDGRVSLWFETTPDMNKTEMLKLNIVQPSIDLIKQNYLQSVNNAVQGIKKVNKDVYEYSIWSSEGVPAECRPGLIDGYINEMVWTDENNDGTMFPYVWQGTAAFFDSDFLRVAESLSGGNPRVQPGKVVSGGESLCASALRSEISDTTDIKDKEAVLFVHGFINSGKLGGYDHDGGAIGGEYFAKFPDIVKGYKGKDNNTQYIPFVFQWRTNAKFEDVALELGNAIKSISDKTGKKVHIVAHSFGGLLTRTLVQGLATDSLYDKTFAQEHIASVTTVGTPHSGTFGSQTTVNFDNEGDVVFPEGRNGVAGGAIELCRAITCYQTGTGYLENSPQRGVGGSEFYGTKDQAGYIVYKLFKDMDEYPTVPTQVLIGLIPESVSLERTESGLYTIGYDFLDDEATQNPGVGDKLISVFGQRVIPDGDQSDLNDVYAENNIEEHILQMDTKYQSSYNRQKDDNLFSLYKAGALVNDDMTKSDYATDVEPIDVQNFVFGYNHRTGEYSPDYYLQAIYKDGSIPDTVQIVSNYLKMNSEVGLQDCKDAATCGNSTWNYFKTFVDLHPAEYVTQDVNIDVSGKVFENGDVPKTPYTIKVFVNNQLIKTQEITNSSEYNISVLFKGKTVEDSYKYYVKVVPDEDSGLRGAVSNEIETDTTVVESSLKFNDILLVSQDYVESTMKVSLVDATDHTTLSDFNISVYNGANLITSGSSNGDTYEVTLGLGDYTCVATKIGYKASSPIPCYSKKDITTTYSINIFRDEAVGTARRIVVLADDITPWDTDSFTNIMADNNYTNGDLNGQYKIVSSVDINVTDFIVGKDMLIIMNDQVQSFYETLSANMDKIDTFVKNGGVLLFEVSDRGWNDASLADAGIDSLPGGVTFVYNYDETNINVNPNSTLMMGLDANLTGNYASHESFENLPDDATVYTTDTNNRATLIEYKYGSGWVIATGQPLEAEYEWDQPIGVIYPRLYNYVLGNISKDEVSQNLVQKDTLDKVINRNTAHR